MKTTFFFLLGASILPHTLPAASNAAMEKEYQQVRTIALRDPRVQSAYRDADRRLDEKMIRIDPALESYVKAKQAAREGTAAPKPAAPFTRSIFGRSTAPKTTHAVAAGETLGSIAAKHRITVASLRMANHIKDERKIPVGQVLTIPAPASAGRTRSTR